MSDYLRLAKEAIKGASVELSEEQFAERGRRNLEETGRGLMVRWSAYPDWLALRDPLTGEWHELLTSGCFPSLVEEADGRRKRGRLLRKQRRKEE